MAWPAPHRLLLLLASIVGADGPAQTPLKKTLVASGLDDPVWLGCPAGDHERLFALELHAGRVRIIRRGQGLLARPFLDLGGGVATGGEQGLLGMAFHPHYAANGWCYVNYTRSSDGATVVARYTVSATDPDLADPGSATTVLLVAQPQTNHNGGDLHFGPDGLLYIGLGDGGSGACRSQDGSLLLGKMLRIDVDGGAPYAIPPGNPLAGQPGLRGEIWHFGLRNPWRFCFDRLTGDMYIADVGWNSKEEISFQPAGQGGMNFGWGTMEGTLCQQTSCPGPVCNSPLLTLPIHEYENRASNPAGGGCAVIGGRVYRGCAIPDLQGRYFFADHCSDRVWSFRYDGQQVADIREHTAELNSVGQQALAVISGFGEDDHGELYVLTMDDMVWRIDADVAAPVTNLGFGKTGSNGQVPTFELCGLLDPGMRAQALLRRAPPSMPAALLFSLQNNPTALPFGTVVTVPFVVAVGAVTDPQGLAQLALHGARGPFTLFAQWVVLDPPVGGSIGISNALRIDFR